MTTVACLGTQSFCVHRAAAVGSRRRCWHKRADALSGSRGARTWGERRAKRTVTEVPALPRSSAAALSFENPSVSVPSMLTTCHHGRRAVRALLQHPVAVAAPWCRAPRPPNSLAKPRHSCAEPTGDDRAGNEHLIARLDASARRWAALNGRQHQQPPAVGVLFVRRPENHQCWETMHATGTPLPTTMFLQAHMFSVLVNCVLQAPGQS